jgi:hypothetical protein
VYTVGTANHNNIKTTKPMKTMSFLNQQTITGTFCAGAMLFITAGASAQTLYDSEQFSGAIDKFNVSGTPTTFVPSSQSLSEMIAFNSSGDLFVGNNSGTSLTEVTPGGTVSSFGSGFNQPFGVAVDGLGNIFVANFGSGVITKVSPNGLTETPFATGLDNPDGLAFNSAGDLFEADWGSGNIYEFVNGNKIQYATGFQQPTGLAFDTAGDLFVANSVGSDVVEVNAKGYNTVLSGLADPQGLAFDNAGDLFVAAAGGSIVELTSSGEKTFSTQVNSPVGLAFAPVPEPSTLALLAVGASAVAMRLRRKK